MKVSIAAHTGRNLATGKVETHSQYRILVDGTLVGYKSWNHGAKICFIGRLSPVDQKEIEEQVDNILGDAASSIMPADLDEYDEVDDSEGEVDDFNA